VASHFVERPTSIWQNVSGIHSLHFSGWESEILNVIGKFFNMSLVLHKAGYIGIDVFSRIQIPTHKVRHLKIPWKIYSLWGSTEILAFIITRKSIPVNTV
jgi:hypothetical protein